MGATKDLYIQIRQIEEALWPNDPRGFEKAIGTTWKRPAPMPTEKAAAFDQVVKLLENPREHTGRGYRKKNNKKSG